MIITWKNAALTQTYKTAETKPFQNDWNGFFYLFWVLKNNTWHIVKADLTFTHYVISAIL